MAERIRQVIREEEFERALRSLASRSRMADEFVDGAEFVLARDPLAGVQLNDVIWFMPMAPVAGMQVTLYYTFDDSTVWLLSIAQHR